MKTFLAIFALCVIVFSASYALLEIFSIWMFDFIPVSVEIMIGVSFIFLTIGSLHLLSVAFSGRDISSSNKDDGEPYHYARTDEEGEVPNTEDLTVFLRKDGESSDGREWFFIETNWVLDEDLIVAYQICHISDHQGTIKTVKDSVAVYRGTKKSKRFPVQKKEGVTSTVIVVPSYAFDLGSEEDGDLYSRALGRNIESDDSALQPYLIAEGFGKKVVV